VSGDTLISVHDRTPLRGAPGLRDLVHFEFEAAAIIREEEDVIVRRADEQVLDEIRVLQILAREPPPAHAVGAGTSRRRCA